MGGFENTCECLARAHGVIIVRLPFTPRGWHRLKKMYEISKSLDFEWDFVISELISKFDL